jgi:Tol biopolymer transport system component
MIDVSTGETTPLPQSLVGGWSYAVSPDGTRFAYSQGACPPCTPPIEVYVGNVDGTGVRRVLTPGVIDAFGPTWSPDGSVLAYQGSGGLNKVGGLFVVDPVTEEVRRITDLAPRRLSRFSLGPSFSPDGGSVLFQLPRGSDANISDMSTRWDLWSVPVAGGEPTLVRRDAAMGVYSPDGSTLAYLNALQASVGGGYRSNLWLADADGSDRRLLLVGRFAFLRWSPDGTRLVYGGDGKIRVVDVASGKASYVADGVTAEWLDQDTLVVDGPASVT